jgi:uncharacterized damage-inducible protein DinB
LIERLHQHRAWVNQSLLEAASSLSDAQLRKPFAIGQGSIWKSLTHLYAAEFVWLEALEGNDNALARGDVPGKLPGNQEGEGVIQSLAELRAEWSTLQSRWIAYLASLMPESLDEIVYKKRSGSTDGKRFGTRRVDVLLHVCTHAHYTTAQVMNMLRQAAVKKLPEVMLIALARQENPN